MDDDNWNPNAEVICPYDSTHSISVKRFQGHLIKCRKNHPDKDFISCPFNAQHLFLRAELKSHLGHCPDRVVLDHDVLQAECPETGEMLQLRGNTSMPKARFQIPEDHENWDNEIEEHVAEKLEHQEAYLRQQGFLTRKTHVPSLRQPKITNEKIMNDIIMNDTSSQDNINDDTSSIASDVSRASSSLYVEPVKQAPNKPKNSRIAKGRGVLIPNSTCKADSVIIVGRGSLCYAKDQPKDETRLKSFGRGSITQALRKFQA